MAEARGVPRGNYDGPVHDVISMTKSVPHTPTTRGPICPKTQAGPRNLHQSGFTLAGRREHVCSVSISNLLKQKWLTLRCIRGNLIYSLYIKQLSMIVDEYEQHHFFSSRCSDWRPHTSSLCSEDCSASWWTIQHHIFILKQHLPQDTTRPTSTLQILQLINWASVSLQVWLNLVLNPIITSKITLNSASYQKLQVHKQK